jgi:hypothetical protein
MLSVEVIPKVEVGEGVGGIETLQHSADWVSLKSRLYPIYMGRKLQDMFSYLSMLNAYEIELLVCIETSALKAQKPGD